MDSTLLCKIFVIAGIILGFNICRALDITPSGRMGRLTFLKTYALIFSSTTPLAYVIKHTNLSQMYLPFGMVSTIAVFSILAVYVVCVVWATICLYIRRLHDMGFSGWWVILLLLLTFYFGYGSLGIMVNIWITLFLSMMPPEPGRNKYSG